MTWPDLSRHEEQRRAMVEHQLRARSIRDPRVLDAMLQAPRHEFVPEQFREQAYADHPLPIGEEQTISQPFIIAISLQALGLHGTETILEIGTGSGYQTALLASLAERVFSVERKPALAQRAEVTLTNLGFKNVQVSIRDGSQGWPEHSPYDGILVSAAAPAVPQSLIEQLRDGGKMVIPIGPPHAQELQLIRKAGSKWSFETIEGCRFVPLIGSEAY